MDPPTYPFEETSFMDDPLVLKSQVQLKKHFESVCIYNNLDLFWKWSQQYL